MCSSIRRKIAPMLVAVACSAFLAAPVAATSDPIRLQQQIAEVDWNIRHSSVASVIDAPTQARSMALLERARDEIAAGHLRTAQGLIRDAARPLVEMRSAPEESAHPDLDRQFFELREAVETISIGAESAARDEGRWLDLKTATTSVITRADMLHRQGRTEEALAGLQARYLEIQVQVAELRDGDLVVVRAPDGRDARHFEDGIRRIDERRQLTEVLILEARAEGIDEAPLVDALNIANATLASASAYARAERWDRAYDSLDLAYAQIEEQWRKVGIEW